MAKGLGKGVDGGTVSRKAVDPLNGFLKAHESILKSLHVDNQSLFQRLEGVVQHLVKMLTDFLERAGTFLKPGSSASAAQPRPGP
ncbi:hypothetical protein D3C77_565470 [compost metagenome]